MRFACVLASDFEDSEYRVPVDRLRSAGHQIVVIGAKKGERLQGKKGKESAEVDVAIDDADPRDFDALFIPGGYSPDQLRADQRFVDFASAFDDEGKLIAAVCHGPQLLLTAGLVEGRRMTAWRTVQVDLACAGADVVDEPVVVDGNLITSRQPGDLDRFAQAILDHAGGPQAEAAAASPA